jgi:hypothetical protein
MDDPIAARIVEFLRQIGLDLRFETLPEPTFLPGIEIRDGALLIDESKLLYPGDLLHEAGHLALMSPEERAVSRGNAGPDAGFEMGAIAWSYAAAVHLEVPSKILFHDEGYLGNSRALIENFEAGRDVGVPMLDWLDLSTTAKNAKARGVPGFPSMMKWLRS